MFFNKPRRRPNAKHKHATFHGGGGLGIYFFIFLEEPRAQTSFVPYEMELPGSVMTFSQD